MSKYTVYLASGNVVEIEADNYYYSGDSVVFIFGDDYEKITTSDPNLIALFQESAFEGVVNNG